MIPHVQGNYIEDKINVRKFQANAEFPYKENQNGVGFNITLIGRVANRPEDITGEVNEFSTGLVITPPKGYYFELVASSSLYKHGYMVAPGVGVINPECEEELIVSLYKFRDTEDIQLPLSAVQIILHKIVFAHLQSANREQKGHFPRSASHEMYPQSHQGNMEGPYQPQFENGGVSGMQSKANTQSKNHMF